MSKSHYFVQKPPEEVLGSNYRECKVCNKLFIPRSKKNVTCSPECSKIYHDRYKAEWEKKNRKRRSKEKYDRRHANGVIEKEKFFKLVHGIKYRKRVIKQELINMELMTFQMTYRFRDKPELDLIHARRGLDQEKADYIKEGLMKLELYTEQIEKSDKYQVDFSREFTKVKPVLKDIEREI